MISSKETLKFFAQPVLKYKVENFSYFNEGLLEYIKKMNKEDNVGITRSNRGGWHSKPFDLKDKNSIQHKFLMETTKYVFDAIKTFGWKLIPERTMVTEMWAIINKPHDFNVIHTHPNSYLSAAYYVKAPKNGGKFVVENPLSVAKHSYPALEKQNEFNIKIAGLDVKEGELLIFPAYLPHKVEENKADEDRIVISFNININNFK